MGYLSGHMNRICQCLLLVFACLSNVELRSQSIESNSLKIITNIDLLREASLKNPSLEMVELKSVVPQIRYGLAYAQKSNFTHHRLYSKRLNATYLRKDVALALKLVAEELSKNGLGIWVWDAYRPYSVTQKFWRLIHDERYVANPSKGSGHNRGIAIDMTIYDLASGSLLEMPTGFDDFSENAHHGYKNLPTNRIENRELLRSLMEKRGFVKFETEWWHYSWPSPSKYDVLDIPFSKLK